MDEVGRERDPTGARTALRIVREAFAETRGKRWRLLLVAFVMLRQLRTDDTLGEDGQPAGGQSRRLAPVL